MGLEKKISTPHHPNSKVNTRFLLATFLWFISTISLYLETLYFWVLNAEVSHLSLYYREKLSTGFSVRTWNRSQNISFGKCLPVAKT